ncbi:MAG: hypothetical protein VKK59_00305 [Vampirovibrionales bacterium]|nr:hypothetical protein [Vampirovibrionales bacterium]
MASWIQRLAFFTVNRALMLIGLGLLVLMATYGVFWWPHPIPKGFSWLVELAEWVACLLMSVGYLGVLAVWHRESSSSSQISQKIPLLIVAALSMLACVLPAFHSTDVTGYINRGWQQVAYHTNPYLTVIDDIAGWRQDAMFRNHWITNPAPYGFAFMHVARALMHLVEKAHGNWLMALLAFKLLMLSATWAVAALVAWAGRRWLAWPRQQALGALMLMMANPLVLIQGLANAHNDVLMALPMMAALALLPSARWGWLSAPLASLGGLIKLAAWSILPMILLLQVRFGQWPLLGFGILLSGLLTLTMAMAYMGDGQWQSWPMAKIAQNATVMHNSLPSLLWYPLEALIKACMAILPEHLAGDDALLEGIKRAIKTVFSLAFVASLLAILRHVFRQSGATQTAMARFQFAVVAALWIQGALIAVFSAKFYPWYCNMFWPLALWLAPGSRLRRMTLALTVGQVFAITALGQAHVLNVLLMWVLPLALAWRLDAFLKMDSERLL